ncbi:ORF311 [Staphylococcus phage G1]|uniref:ORF311 n=1 Tax=Staphylococcus phage G1 TaxID=2908166 RepID=Q4ZA07_9CAUD|nr:ORF311 [Staphylococcus phage G1]AAX92289.1 ORF311 [Staphylococcus phage G1]
MVTLWQVECLVVVVHLRVEAHLKVGALVLLEEKYLIALKVLEDS